MLKHDHYTYRVNWSAQDNEYVGICLEFPSLSWLDASIEKALHGIRELVGGVISDMQANKEVAPEPLAEKKYSGKFVVRVPQEIHRELALQAAQQGISLNRVVSAKLAHG